MDVRPEWDEPDQPDKPRRPADTTPGQFPAPSHPADGNWTTLWGMNPQASSPEPAPSAAPAPPTQPGGPPARHLANYVPYIAEQRAQQAREILQAAETPARAPSRSGSAGRSEAAGCASGAAIIALLSKVAAAGKVLLPFLSAVVSLIAYASLFGWQFGVGILAILFVHEMGHYVIIRAKGLPASWPVFIPMLGAYVAMRRMPMNVRDEAEIAIAGPFAGAMASALCFWLYQATGLLVLLPLAYFSFLINLLNLIPVSPLDGGRIVGAISRWIWPIGLMAMVVAFLYTHNILLLLLLWLGFIESIRRFRLAASGDPYYKIPLLTRAYITVFYFGLAAALAIGMFATEGLMVAQMAGRPLFGG